MARKRWWSAVIVLALATCTGCCAFADRWCGHRGGGYGNGCCYPAAPACCCYPANASPAGNTGWNNPAPAGPAAPACPPCR